MKCIRDMTNGTRSCVWDSDEGTLVSLELRRGNEHGPTEMNLAEALGLVHDLVAVATQVAETVDAVH